MKNKNLMIIVIMLFAFLLLASTGLAETTSAETTAEEEMARAIFETIKNNDFESFSTYLATDKRMADLVEGIKESTDMEIAIKQELREEDSADFRDECVLKYELLLKELNTDETPIEDAVFQEITANHSIFEITNLKPCEVSFTASFNGTAYEIEINTFNTNADIFIYDFQFREISK